MKHRKPISIALSCILILATISLISFHHLHKKTVTGYVDSNLHVYKCSRPIAAKEGRVPTLAGLGNIDGDHLKGLVPVDMNEARKYCHYVGIE